MVNNDNQEIHTGYVANDIFKPVNANQLAKSIHYDFVITQDMFDNYVTAHKASEGDKIDIGNVIASTMDGSDGSWEVPVNAPCSIYIAADTQAYILNFTSRLCGSSKYASQSPGYIIDWADYTDDSGNKQYPLTADVVNVYSAYPYQVFALAGGFNFWSTINAYVILKNPGTYWEGICRIGYYKLNTQFDMYTRPGDSLQLVWAYRVSGYYPKATLSAGQASSGYVPAIIFANWMGGATVTTEYTINDTDTSIPGLYQSLAAAYQSYNQEIILQVYHTSSTGLYVCTHRSASEICFTNADTGETIAIAVDGTITTRDSSISSTIGATSKVIVSDFCINPTDSKYQITPLESVTTYLANRVSVIRPGCKKFLSIQDDTGEAYAHDWYMPSTTSGSGPYALFKFKGATTLEWFTWYAISLVYQQDSSNCDVLWYKNTRSSMYLDAESLVEGIVYEVNIHIMKFPAKEYVISFASGTSKTALKQAAPYATISEPAGFSDLLKPSIMFYRATTRDSATVRYWGTEKTPSWTYGLYPSFHLHITSPVTTDGYKNSNGMTELAFASVKFVKLGDYVYIMDY